MAESAQTVLKEDVARFSSDSQLLSELGERLIATPQIALAELIKNSYDADASRCHIWLEDEDREVIVKDDGHGMTEDEFLNFWMTIATPNRTRDPTSRRYDREVTGSKGVGRFAVRNLGRALELRTVAYDEREDEYLRLIATFDWEEFQAGSGLQEMEIPYRLERGADEEEEGTTLRISKLQESWSDEKLHQVSEEVLDIVSSPFETERQRVKTEDEDDPGFAVFFAPPGEESPYTSATRELYERYVARVEVVVDGTTVTYEYEYDEAEPRTYTFELDENLIGNIDGEIRYFPRRPGVFRDMETMDGRQAYSWLNRNGGVRIIDKNFRVPPYGEEGDDWLELSDSVARRDRQWRSPFTSRIHPDEDFWKEESRDPHLRLPGNHQVLGAINVSSYRPDPGDSPESRLQYLQPAMDRQGFVENDGMNQLRDVVRSSLEVLAIIDREETTKKKLEKTKERKTQVRREIQSAIQEVEERPDLDPETKREIVESYGEIEEEIRDYEEAQEEARTAVESMHLLGVVSAFMTHETDVMLGSAQQMLEKWKEIPEDERDEEFEERLQVTEEAIGNLKSHLDYSKAFMGNLKKGTKKSFKVRPQVELIIEQFDSYTEPREIETENGIPSDLTSPEINISLYSGVILNLYTNAIKAVQPISTADREKRIRFDAEDTDEGHIIRVSDTGVGIPDELRDRIFDPIFSTTDIEGPLGTGMGLGLFIVKRALESLGGSIKIVEPPTGFETCFEVKYT